VKIHKKILNALAGSPAKAFISGIGIVAAAIACAGYGLPMAYAIMALAVCLVTRFVVAAFLVIVTAAFDAMDPEHTLNAPAQTDGKDKP